MKALDVAFNGDVRSLQKLELTSHEVLFSSTGLQLAGLQLVYALEKITMLNHHDEKNKAQALKEIRQLLSDGIALLQQDGKVAIKKGETFRPVIQSQLKLLALLANDSHKNRNAAALFNQITSHTPDIVRHLASEYRRLLYIS